MDSPSVATEITTGRLKIFLKKYLNRVWSRHHSLLGKTIEKPNLKMSTNQIQRFGSRLRMGKVLAPTTPVLRRTFNQINRNQCGFIKITKQTNIKKQNQYINKKNKIC